MFGVTLSDGTTTKHTYTDFGMRMTVCNVPKPEPKISKIDIPFASGSYDITEITGEINYNDIEGVELEFKIYDGDFTKWERAKSELAAFIHGKKLEMILDSDQRFFYVVRLTVNSSKSNKAISTIVLSGSAEPFKYAVRPLGEDWEWDTFNFKTGQIYQMENITISNGGSVDISTKSVLTVPEFEVTQSTNLALSFNGKSYPMSSPGKYYFPQVRIGYDTTALTFTGSGKLNIVYRGRFL